MSELEELREQEESLLALRETLERGYAIMWHSQLKEVRDEIQKEVERENPSQVEGLGDSDERP